MSPKHTRFHLEGWLFCIALCLAFGISTIGCSDRQTSAGNDQSNSETLRQFESANSFAPETSARLLSPSELQGLSKFQLRIMRNEILARHGYVFKSKELNDYFTRQTWYAPDPSFRESDLSKVEIENIALIVRQEKNEGRSTTPPRQAKETVDLWARRYAAAEGQQVYGKKTFTVDFDDDGDLDVIGLCALGGGGSGYYQYMAAFRNTSGDLSFIASGDAGGAGTWTVNNVRSGGNERIYCLIDRWLDDDANCCPTGKSYLTFHISGESIVPE